MKNTKLMIFLFVLCFGSIHHVVAEEKPTKQAEVKMLFAVNAEEKATKRADVKVLFAVNAENKPVKKAEVKVLFAVNAEDKPVKKAEVKVLIVGLNDNVKSNYYYDASIAEETGINVDSIVMEFNRIIAENIEEALPKSTCKFLAATHHAATDSVLSKIECNGEAEQANSNLTALPAAVYQEMLGNADAKYMLVLNQHYLKRQDQPMRTVFHIVSYTLYDQDRKEVYKGNQFFTAMKLESADRIKALSRKSTAKIASSIVKVLER